LFKLFDSRIADIDPGSAFKPEGPMSECMDRILVRRGAFAIHKATQLRLQAGGAFETSP
jgi:hypothetical protein